MMKRRAANRWGLVATTVLVGMDAMELLGQMNERQFQKYQAQQMQRMVRESLGPAANVAPNIGSDRPMENALWGYGAELVDAVENVREQVNAYGQSRAGISAEVLKQALPQDIGDYRQTHLQSADSESATHTLVSGKNMTSSVTATYQNSLEQTVVVTLTDLGLYMDLTTEQQQSDAAILVENAETEEAIMQAKEIQGIKAHIQYDRLNHSGNLMMKANRVLINIQGQNIPFIMLETSANEINISHLAQLGEGQS